MTIRLCLLLNLFLISSSAQASAEHSRDLAREAAGLESHLALAKEPRAYLEVRPDAVVVYVKGVEVRRLPFLKSDLPGSRRVRSSRVASKRAAVATREVVVRVEQISANPADTVSSPDEIVSVDDMPETFAFTLVDGSTFFVTGKASDGVLNGKRKDWLRFRVACSFVIDRLLGRPVKVAFLEMDPGSARYFYWLLQNEMGVIY